jgi:hypothetical protein
MTTGVTAIHLVYEGSKDTESADHCINAKSFCERTETSISTWAKVEKEVLWRIAKHQKIRSSALMHRSSFTYTARIPLDCSLFSLLVEFSLPVGLMMTLHSSTR